LQVVEPQKANITFYNPMGESNHQTKMILRNWRYVYPLSLHDIPPTSIPMIITVTRLFLITHFWCV